MSAGHHHDTEGMGDARIAGAIAINVLLTVAQIIGGVISGSLSLIADSLHNLNDAVSLGIALIARRIARRPADERRPFGYFRAEIVGALINLTTLIIVGLYLIYQAVERFFQQEPVDGWIVVILAGIALVIDVATALLTFSMSKGNLNIKAAFIHNISDALASIAVMVAGTLIILFDFIIADLIATGIISAYILYQGATLMGQTINILMEGTPDNINVRQLTDAVRQTQGVADVRDLRVWQLNEQHMVLLASVVTERETLTEIEQVKRSIRAMLARDYDIDQVTLEIDSVDGAPARADS